MIKKHAYPVTSVCRNFYSSWSANLAGTLPAHWSAMTYLSSLSLPNNNIAGAIPSGIADLKALTRLDLWMNKLTGVVPGLPFAQYTVGCWLSNSFDGYNAFACPLPPGSSACTPGPPKCVVKAHSWTELRALCEASGSIVLSASFDSADYDSSYIDINNNRSISIVGNGAVLDARKKGNFFHVSSGSSLTLESITLQNGYPVSERKVTTPHSTLC